MNWLAIKKKRQGLPWWLSGKESTYQFRGLRFLSWVRKISREGNGNPLQSSSFLLSQGLPWLLSLKRINLQCGRPSFYPWVGKIPWRRESLPTAVFWPGEYNGVHRPWGCKKSDTNEQFSLSGILAWEISGTDEPGGLQSMRSQRVG